MPKNNKIMRGSRLGMNTDKILKKGNKCRDLRLHSSFDIVKDNLGSIQNGS